MATIYGPQDWDDTFSYPSAYQSADYGGADTPHAGYPETAVAENVQIVAGGSNGEDVLEAVDTGNYTVAGVILRYDAVLGDPLDQRGVSYEWWQKLLTSALNEAGSSRLLVRARGGDILSAHKFLEIRTNQTTWDDFSYQLNYRRPTGVGSGTTSATSFALYACDITTGAGGAEVVQVPEIVLQTDDVTEGMYPAVTSYDVVMRPKMPATVREGLAHARSR